MTEYLLIAALPVAAYAGWWLARTIQRKSSNKKNRLFSSQYFQGLNYLLNEQPDKAIEVFLELADVNEDTVETHMALGNLFRRRGEVDRAIRFHQNIIAKERLKPEQRTRALLELGEDYMRAGLLDRAEVLFSELIESDSHTPPALRSLLEIYQQEKDWAEAVEQARRLEKITGEHMGDVMAQFCCEMAQDALDAGNREDVRRHLRQARRHHPECVRSRLIVARLCELEENFEGAMDAYEEVASLDTDYVADIIGPYLKIAKQAGMEKRCREQLESWKEDYDGITLTLKITEFLAQEKGNEEAGQYLIDVLSNKPSVRGLDHLIDMSREGYLPAGSGDDILKAVTSRLLQREPRYRCSHCGFSGLTHHWQCPSCKRWSTTKTIHGVLGE
ncbi:MAG TPA: lipopolysaccharide assembly protein LapB [Xanthomonadales bacterium]|nr:lipopolysaccharide assembly protein LapB [Xanthomonadales bacterium]